MEFFRFLEKESKALDRRLMILGIIAGMLNMFIIFTLTVAAGKATQSESNLKELAMVAFALAAYWLSEGTLMRHMTVIVEEIVEKVRVRIVHKIRNSDLASIEQIGRAPPFNVVSMHATTISRAAGGVISGFTSLVLLCWAFLIILYLSVTAFLILIGALGFILLMLKMNQARIGAGLTAAVGEDNKFVHGFGHLIDGFKELKMNSAKFHDFLDDHLEPLAARAKEFRTDAGLVLNRSILLATASLFFVLAALIFLLPVLSPGEVPKLIKITTFVVFIFGPLGQVVGFYPFLNEGVASIREIQRVEKLLDSIYEHGLADPSYDTKAPVVFNALRCHGLAFSYRDEHGQSSFSLEPLDFELSKGEMVFITGGNGSGKSTFLKVLAGLYQPASGSITVNGAPIGRDDRQSYRDLYSAIFSDFHLFDRVYGVKDVDQDRLRNLFEMTELSLKTSIVDRQITTVDLSSGQRKRLALVLSLLEDKPILLLDEWAAEQDPQFRRKFYREILPWLKQQEKTVVAVTHDDDHYDVADRILKMQYGNFVRS
jgi:putative pyoverdin transport system ATP-binding/permease protein